MKDSILTSILLLLIYLFIYLFEFMCIQCYVVKKTVTFYIKY